MGGQFVAAAALVVGCNQLTGVGDLKVAGCGLDAGADAGSCETGQAALNTADAQEPELGSGGADGVTGAGGAGASNRGGGSSSSSAGSEGTAGDPNLPFSGSCEPDSTLRCLGEANCVGTQRCLADGASFSDCECGSAPAPGAGSVGGACAVDADCATGLACTSAQATSGPFSGGVQGGFCSRPCAGDADCVAVDPGALCISHAQGPAFCFPECSTLQPSFPAQCNGRSELACFPLAEAGRGYCAPTCQSDEGCAPRACDLSTGLCSDGVREGEPIGGACASNQDCAAGLCATLPGQAPACTGLCTLGSLAGCGFAENASPRLAACTASTGGELGALLGLGLGTGLCQQLCDVDGDCAQADAGWGCSPWPNPESEARFGRAGACEPLGPEEGGDDGCSNACPFAADGVCDDGGEGSFLPLCGLGTDCADCGPR